MQCSQPLPVVEDKDEAKGENSHHVDAQRQQEKEEVAVVPPSDAVVHPWTVMVEVLRRSYTVIHKKGLNHVTYKKVMISPMSICFFVSRITQKLLNEFPQNLDGKWVSTQKRPHKLLVQIQIKQQIKEFPFFVKHWWFLLFYLGIMVGSWCVFRWLVTMSTKGDYWALAVPF